MKTKIIIELFSPIVKPYNNPSKLGLVKLEFIKKCAGPVVIVILSRVKKAIGFNIK